MAEPTVPRPAVQNFSRSQFRDLCNHRDAVAYFAVACAQQALACLNLGEAEKAQNILLSGLDLFQRAEDKITKFAKENLNGNAAA